MQSPGAGWPDWRYFGQFAIVIVAAGAGEYDDEHGRHRSLHVGDCILVQPELGHSYHAVGRHWTTGYVVFQGPVFDSWLAEGALAPLDPVAMVGRPQTWLQRLRRFVERRQQSSPGDEQLALSEVCDLQILLRDLVQAAGQPTNIAQRVAERLLQPGSWHDPIEQVAVDCGLSVASLRRLVKQHWGTSPHRLRMRALVDRACELLLTGEWADHEVADRLGFADPQHFSKVFKRVRGLSPRAYRRRLG